nr:alpha/beta hydrolase [uncultured Neokomagataea sp.]
MKPTFLLRAVMLVMAWRQRNRARGAVRGVEPVIPDVPGHAPSAAALRELRRAMGRPCFPVCLSSLRLRRWLDMTVGGDGRALRARVFRPRGAVHGVVLFLHGGGFVHCNTRSHHGICCRLAAAAGAVVVSLEYRLAPEHRFPAAIDDARMALRWIAEALPDVPLAVAGDSAGGTLSAGLAQWAREALPGRLKGQLLFYPALTGPIAPESRFLFAQGYMLTEEVMNWYCGQTLSQYRELFDPRFAPALADNMADLPPALTVTAGFDPLRDEGGLYTRLLRQNGIEARHVHYPRMIHGFLNGYSFLKDGQRALRVGGAFLREVLRG